MKNWINLYTFLIDNVSLRYCFGKDVFTEIKAGYIKVNGLEPDSINSLLNKGDIISVNGKEYVYEGN